MVKKISSLIIIIIILLVLLGVSIFYIAYDKYDRFQKEKQLSENTKIYQQGAQAGFEQAIITIAQQASTCNQVPLRLGNQTMNIIWIDCLRAVQQEQQQNQQQTQ